MSRRSGATRAFELPETSITPRCPGFPTRRARSSPPLGPAPSAMPAGSTASRPAALTLLAAYVRRAACESAAQSARPPGAKGHAGADSTAQLTASAPCPALPRKRESEQRRPFRATESEATDLMGSDPMAVAGPDVNADAAADRDQASRSSMFHVKQSAAPGPLRRTAAATAAPNQPHRVVHHPDPLDPACRRFAPAPRRWRRDARDAGSISARAAAFPAWSSPARLRKSLAPASI